MHTKDAHKVAYAMLECKQRIVVQGYQEASVLLLIDYVRAAYPLLFHLGDVHYEIYANNSVVLCPQYIMDSATYQNLLQQVTEKTTVIKTNAQRYKTKILQEKYIHDYLCKQVQYADIGDESHSVIGPLLQGRGVCEGIAKTMQLLLKSVGIEAWLVAGMSQSGEKEQPEKHVWNVVQIDDKWYHLDVTFDLTLSVEQVRYDYFNLDSSAIVGDHEITFDPMQKSELCTSKKDIFVLSNRFFKDASEVGLLLRRLLAEGKQYLHFRMDGPYDEVQNRQIIQECEKSIKRCDRQATCLYSINKQRNIYAFYIDIGNA